MVGSVSKRNWDGKGRGFVQRPPRTKGMQNQSFVRYIFHVCARARRRKSVAKDMAAGRLGM